MITVFVWRTWDKQEIDFVEERDGKLFGYEFKCNKTQIKIPSAWTENYNNAKIKVITKDNYLEFIT
jgi:predicted AAA+ superfamily ATPase